MALHKYSARGGGGGGEELTQVGKKLGPRGVKSLGKHLGIINIHSRIYILYIHTYVNFNGGSNSIILTTYCKQNTNTVLGRYTSLLSWYVFQLQSSRPTILENRLADSN